MKDVSVTKICVDLRSENLLFPPQRPLGLGNRCRKLNKYENSLC